MSEDSDLIVIEVVLSTMQATIVLHHKPFIKGDSSFQLPLVVALLLTSGQTQCSMKTEMLEKSGVMMETLNIVKVICQ